MTAKTFTPADLVAYLQQMQSESTANDPAVDQATAAKYQAQQAAAQKIHDDALAAAADALATATASITAAQQAEVTATAEARAVRNAELAAFVALATNSFQPNASTTVDIPDLAPAVDPAATAS